MQFYSSSSSFYLGEIINLALAALQGQLETNYILYFQTGDLKLQRMKELPNMLTNKMMHQEYYKQIIN
jgi:hypothetical protein